MGRILGELQLERSPRSLLFLGPDERVPPCPHCRTFARVVVASLILQQLMVGLYQEMRVSHQQQLLAPANGHFDVSLQNYVPSPLLIHQLSAPPASTTKRVRKTASSENALCEDSSDILRRIRT
jgi:hypothetical protein